MSLAPKYPGSQLNTSLAKSARDCPLAEASRSSLCRKLSSCSRSLPCTCIARCIEPAGTGAKANMWTLFLLKVRTALIAESAKTWKSMSGDQLREYGERMRDSRLQSWRLVRVLYRRLDRSARITRFLQRSTACKRLQTPRRRLQDQADSLRRMVGRRS